MISDTTRVRLARALLQPLWPGARLDQLCTEHGPTDRMIDLVGAGGGPLSSGERLMLLAAWDVWRGGGHDSPSLGAAIGRLDDRCLRRLGEVLVALSRGDAAARKWLDSLGV